MADIFISYSRRDTEFVRKLHQALAERDRDVWVDWEDIPATADWWNEICAGINSADTFAFIISPDSTTSDVCRREIDHAVANNKHFIPILYRSLVTDSSGRINIKDHIHPAISSHNWIYFEDPDQFDKSFAALLTALDTDLDYIREHTRLLVRGREWERQGRDKSFLLAGLDVQHAERWLAEGAEKTPKPLDLHIEYIQASRKEAVRRQRTLFAGIAIITIIAALALLSFFLFQNAQSNLTLAEERGTQVAQQVVTSDHNANLAATQAANARLNASTALAAQGTSDFNAVEAQTQAANAQLSLRTAIAAQGTSDYNAADAATQAESARENAATATIAQGEALIQAQTAVAAQGTSDANAGTAIFAQINAVAQAHTAVAAQSTSDANAATATIAQGEAQIQANIAATQAGLALEAQSTSDANAAAALAAQSTSNANAATAVAAQSTSDANAIDAQNAEGTANALRSTAEGDAISNGATAIAALATSDILGTAIAQQAVTATVAQGQAEYLAQTAVAAQSTSDANAIEAATQAANAQDNANLAAQAQATAVYNEQQARAQALAVNGDQLLDAGYPGIAIALGLEASKLDPSLTHAQQLINRAVPFASRLNLPGTSRVDVETYLDSGKEKTREVTVNSFGGLFYTDPDTRNSLMVNSPDGTSLVVYNLSNREILYTLTGHTGWVTAAAFSADGKYLISGSEDGAIIVWDMDTGEMVRQLQAQAGRVSFLVTHPDRNEVISVTEDINPQNADDINASIVWWDIETGEALSTTTSYDGPITGVFYADNGQQAYAYATDQDFPQRWQIEPGKESTYRDLPAKYLGFSPDGRYGYTGGDGTGFLKLWTASTGVLAREFKLGNANDDYVTALAFAPDGLTIAVSIENRGNFQPDGSYAVLDHRAEMWNIRTGERVLRGRDETPYRIILGTDPNQNWSIYSMAFSGNGEYLLIGSAFDSVNTLVVWDVDHGRALRQFTGHSNPIRQLAFSDDGQYAFSTGGSNTRVWDISDRESTQVAQFSVGSAARQIAFQPTGDPGNDPSTNPSLDVTIYANTKAGVISAWQVERQDAQQLNSNNVGSSPQAFSPTGPYALVATSNRTSEYSNLYLWDMTSGEAAFANFSESVHLRVSALSYSADGQHVVMGGSLPVFPGGGQAAQDTYSLLIYDVSTQQIVQELPFPDDLKLTPVTIVALNPDNTLAASLSVSEDGLYTIVVWDVDDGTEVRRYENLPAAVNALAFSPNGRTMVAAFGQSTNSVYVWDVESGDQLLTLIGHTAAVNALAFSPDGETLLTGSDDQSLILWDMTNGQSVRRFRGHTDAITTVAFSSDGRTAASASDRDGVILWRIESLEETVNWAKENRDLVTLTCSQRTQYNVQPLCIDGIVPTATPTGTLFPTSTPTITLTPSITPTPSPTPVPMGSISGNQTVRLRAGAGTGFSQVGVVSPGESFIILGELADGWINIRLEDGTEGWVIATVVTQITP